MAVFNNHSFTFQLSNPGIELNKSENKILYTLNLYHVCILEQFYLDYLNPALNSAKLSNVAPTNIGSLGKAKSDYFKNNLSLEFIGRVYTQATKELHKTNNLGRKPSESTRIKLSASSGGVKAYVLDCKSNLTKEYSNKTLAAKALGISLRTFSRWVEDPSREHQVISNKFTKVKVSLKPFV
jgi:hypothetical protein